MCLFPAAEPAPPLHEEKVKMEKATANFPKEESIDGRLASGGERASESCIFDNYDQLFLFLYFYAFAFLSTFRKDDLVIVPDVFEEHSRSFETS